MKNKKVFISGGAGVIGLELVKLLHEKGAIILVGDLQDRPNGFSEKIFYRKGDLNFITQEELDEFEPEYFFHLAATFERSEETYQHWEENFWHNIRLSNHLMTIMRNVKTLKKVINCSSYLIYDKRLYQFDSPTSKTYSLSETDDVNPRNLTGLAKLSHEIELNFLDKFKSNQFTSISARIYRGYGFNSRDVISRWIRLLINKEEITVYNKDGVFDYMFGTDTAEGLFRLAQTNYSGIVNLGTGKSRKVSDIIEILINEFPDCKIKYIDSNELIEKSQANTTLLKNITNWVPSRKLEKTIPEIIEFERNRSATEILPKLSKILITSISNKISLLKNIKESCEKLNGNWKIYGSDMNPNCLGRFFVDSFIETNKLDYNNPKELISLCLEKKISIIIPTRDAELDFFDKYRSIFEDYNINIMLTNNVKRFTNKKLFYETFSTKFNLIKTSEQIDDIKQKQLVVKETSGSGSRNIGLNLTKEKALLFSKKLNKPIFQPYINGEEFSVDGYCDMDYKLLGLVIRKREIVVGGESKVTTILTGNNPLYNHIIKIINEMKIQYHFVLQFIIDNKGKIHVLECNARYGGASSLSIKSGLKSFQWFLEHNNFNKKLFIPKKQITQVRYEDNLFL